MTPCISSKRSETAESSTSSNDLPPKDDRKKRDFLILFLIFLPIFVHRMTHSILIKGIISALLGILMLSGCTNHETEKPLDLPADLFREGEILYFEKVQSSPARLCCRPIKKAPILTPVFSNSLPWIHRRLSHTQRH